MDTIPDMSGISNLELLKKAIRETFPTVNPNWPIILDDQFDLALFEDRKTVFYQATEVFQNFDLTLATKNNVEDLKIGKRSIGP